MGLDFQAEQLMGDQVSDLVRHRLLEEVFAVFPVQLRVEAQLVFRQVSHAGFLSTQLETHLGAGKGAFEKGFSLLVALFYAA